MQPAAAPPRRLLGDTVFDGGDAAGAHAEKCAGEGSQMALPIMDAADAVQHAEQPPVCARGAQI